MTVAVRETATTRSAEHRFFSTMSVVAAVVVLTGFANTYPARVLSANAAIPAIVHHPAYIFGFAASVFVFPPVVAALSASPAWHSLAASIMR